MMSTFKDAMELAQKIYNISPDKNTSQINIPTLEDPHLAKWMYKRIVESIKEFEKSIPETMQAGGRFVSSPTGASFSIDDVDYWNPDMIRFYGTLPDGAKVQLLQHTSQLNLLLVAVPRRDDLSKPRRKIGFSAEAD